MSAIKDNSDYVRLTEALQAWSRHWAGAHRTSLSWGPALKLIRSATKLDQQARRHLAGALERSNSKLSPLSDPLALNLGAHRWLAADREESYSDWLAWIIQGIATGASVLSLFSEEEFGAALLGPVGRIRRESRSELGRTDIEVPLGEKGLLLIEVKVHDTGDELSFQLSRYAKKAANICPDEHVLVLLGIDAPDPRLELFGFEFVSWAQLCQRLRRYARDLKELELLRAAAILIFCGAVEQNLLGLSAEPMRFRAKATVDYLLEWGTE